MGKCSAWDHRKRAWEPRFDRFKIHQSRSKAESTIKHIYILNVARDVFETTRPTERNSAVVDRSCWPLQASLGQFLGGDELVKIFGK